MLSTDEIKKKWLEVIGTRPRGSGTSSIDFAIMLARWVESEIRAIPAGILHEHHVMTMLMNDLVDFMDDLSLDLSQADEPAEWREDWLRWKQRFAQFRGLQRARLAAGMKAAEAHEKQKDGSDNRPFPIQLEMSKSRWGRAEACSIPWWLAQEAYAEYSKRYGTSQSLERLAERGGFGRDELLTLLRARPDAKGEK